MEDKSIFGKSQPQGISDTLRNFIEALVEEVVKEAKPFDATKKKWLRKYSENEGLDYEKLEKHLTDFFETVEELKRIDSKVMERMAKTLGKDCYLTDDFVERMVSAAGKSLYDVVLKDCGYQKLDVVKMLKEYYGFSLYEAKTLADNVPAIIRKEVSVEETRETKDYFERLGAVIEISGVEEVKKDESAGCRILPSGDMEFSARSVRFKMVKVEGGTFWMGAHCKTKGILFKTPDDSIPNYDSEANDNESPVHKVTLETFYMGETEVTQDLWRAVMGSNPSEFKGNSNPVECVSWDDCQEFIRKLNTLLSSQLGGRRFCLPTEAEWEYAARGGNRSHGYKYSGGNLLDDVAWYDDNSSGRTHPVAQKQANELGLYDMSGNVLEWCIDWYDSYSSSAQTDPIGLGRGPASGSGRVIRGGSWCHDAWGCRVSVRNFKYPDYRNGHNLGLRLSLR